MIAHYLRSSSRRRRELLVALLVVLSPAAALAQYSPAFSATWTGSESQSWADSRNWSTSDQVDWYPGEDTAHEDCHVIIPSPLGMENYPPELDKWGGVTIRSLLIEPLGELQIKPQSVPVRTLHIEFMGESDPPSGPLEPLFDCYGTLRLVAGSQNANSALFLNAGSYVTDTTAVRFGMGGRIMMDNSGDPAGPSPWIFNATAGKFSIDLTTDDDEAATGTIDGSNGIIGWPFNPDPDPDYAFTVHERVTLTGGGLTIHAPLILDRGHVKAGGVSLFENPKYGNYGSGIGLWDIDGGTLTVGRSGEAVTVSGAAPWDNNGGLIHISALADCTGITGQLRMHGGQFEAWGNWTTTKDCLITAGTAGFLVDEDKSVKVKGVTIGGPNGATVTKSGAGEFKTY